LPDVGISSDGVSTLQGSTRVFGIGFTLAKPPSFTLLLPDGSTVPAQDVTVDATFFSLDRQAAVFEVPTSFASGILRITPPGR
jgi:hypothetical protein